MAKRKRKGNTADGVVQELIVAFNMEMETVQNYLCNSINLDGVRAEEIKKSLATDIQEELNHATMLGKRIKVLGGMVPGSLDLKASQKSLQPIEDTTDVVAVIKGVIEAEDGVIDQYQKIIELTDGSDYVTQDLVIQLLGDEQEHRRQFTGFMREYTR